MTLVPDGLQAQYLQHLQMQQSLWQKLLEQYGYRGILLASGSEQPLFQDDQTQPFRASAWFRAWLPLIDRPDCYLLLASDAVCPTLFYHQPQDIWHKVDGLTDAAVLGAFKVVILPDVNALADHLPASGCLAFMGELRDCPRQDMDCNPRGLLTELDYRRAYKSDYELGCMRLASELAVAGHEAARHAFEQGSSEFEIHLAYLRATGHLESELPYPNIIGLNRHAAILHYTRKQRRPPEAHFNLLIDAGASVAGYAADITRTWPAGGDFAALVAALNALQLRLIGELHPGMNFLDLHLAAHRYLAQLLVDVELVRCTAEAALANGLTSVFFPHGLGHLLGLQVHDRGGWLQSPQGDVRKPPAQHPYLRLTRTIESGQVFTVEPGLYFIESLLQPLRGRSDVNWTLVDHWLPCGGIRIEDNIAMTESGTRNLTREAFAGLSATAC